MLHHPTVIEKEGNIERAYDLYSRMLKDNTVFLVGPVNDQSANLIVSQLLYLDSLPDDRPIYFYINSPGGSVYAGLAIYDTMKFIKKDVITVCNGLAASMGAFLLAAGDQRMSLPNSTIMIHQPSGGSQGQASDIKIQAEEILRLRKRLNQILADNTGQSIEKIEVDTERDNFISAEAAVEYGIIDKVITQRDN